MADPVYDLRQGEAGEFLTGTPGNVLTFVGDGRRVQGVPPAAPAEVFYQTIANDDGPFPQEPELLVGAGLVLGTALGATTLSAPDIAVAQSAADAAQATANIAVTAANAAQATATAAQQPFKGTYYVDPAFAGTQTGSASNPFTTIAAAFAAMVALALVGGVVRIPPWVTVTEDVVFPDTGGNYEIESDTGFDSSSVGARLNGTVTATSTSATFSSFRFSNILLTGNIVGNASNGAAELIFRSVRQVGTTTLTVSGTGVWVSGHKGDGPPASSKIGGSNTGLVNVACPILADAWVFVAGVSDGGTTAFNPPAGSQFHDCQFGDLTGGAVPIGLNGVAGNATRFLSCFFNGPVTFTVLNVNHTILMDEASYASLLAQGVTFAGAGAATAKIQVLGASASDVRTLAGNLGSTNLGARAAPGLYEFLFDDTLLAAGTLGTAQHNVIYTDMTGALVTAPVGGGLLITAAVGTKAAGALQFQHNGAAAPIAHSVTGVTTAGALSIASACSVRKVS